MGRGQGGLRRSAALLSGGLWTWDGRKGGSWDGRKGGVLGWEEQGVDLSSPPRATVSSGTV